MPDTGSEGEGGLTGGRGEGARVLGVWAVGHFEWVVTRSSGSVAWESHRERASESLVDAPLSGPLSPPRQLAFYAQSQHPD